MALKDIRGNQDVVSMLKTAVGTGKISHAYILEGAPSIDKLAIAQNFIKAVLCIEVADDACDQCISCKKIDHGNYEDLICLAADGISIKDEAVEELQTRLKTKPLFGKRNVVIIENADTMTLRAQNRFLKTLEEPPEGVVILLLSENTENLASTIQSRCTHFILRHEEGGIPEEMAGPVGEIAAMLLLGAPFYESAAALADFSASRDAASNFLNSLEIWCRDRVVCFYDREKKLVSSLLYEDVKKQARLYEREKLYLVIKAAGEARKDLSRNLNPAYVLKNMVLKIARTG